MGYKEALIPNNQDLPNGFECKGDEENLVQCPHRRDWLSRLICFPVPEGRTIASCTRKAKRLCMPMFKADLKKQMIKLEGSNRRSKPQHTLFSTPGCERNHLFLYLWHLYTGLYITYTHAHSRALLPNPVDPQKEQCIQNFEFHRLTGIAGC